MPFDVRIALGALFRLPLRGAVFYIRAHRVARRSGDGFALSAPTRPKDLAQLLKLAKGCRHTVELGTGTAWTAVALVITDAERRVISYDPYPQQNVDEYLSLVKPQQLSRLQLRADRAERGPLQDDMPVEFLFIDIGGHSRVDTAASFLSWRDALAPGAVVAFHDYGPQFPGVPMAVAQLGLDGEQAGESLFVWRAPV